MSDSGKEQKIEAVYQRIRREQLRDEQDIIHRLELPPSVRERARDSAVAIHGSLDEREQ